MTIRTTHVHSTNSYYKDSMMHPYVLYFQVSLYDPAVEDYIVKYEQRGRTKGCPIYLKDSLEYMKTGRGNRFKKLAEYIEANAEELVPYYDCKK